MGAEQGRHRRGHGIQIQRQGLVDVPAEGSLERICRGPQPKTVDVALGHRMLAGEEARRRRLDRHDPDVHGQVSVQGREQAVWLPGTLGVDEHPLSPCVHASIRPPGALGQWRFRIEGLESLPQIPLTASQHRLDLPAVEAASRVGDLEEVGMGHAP